jgi:hypothetical protein
VVIRSNVEEKSLAIHGLIILIMIVSVLSLFEESHREQRDDYSSPIWEHVGNLIPADSVFSC